MNPACWGTLTRTWSSTPCATPCWARPRFGDIGQHFPSSDERWRGVSSLHFLQAVSQMLRDNRYELGNADVTIVAQRPRLGPYLPQMAATLAAAANAAPAQLNVKASTTDGLGFAGLEKGIAAYAVCLVRPL